MANGFTKIVYSNAQIDLFPENRAHEFTNKLAQPLRLNENWEVALLDIQYFHKWNNLLCDVKVGVLVPRARSERIFRSNLIRPTQPKFKMVVKKRIPHLTQALLKTKKMTERRLGVVLVYDGKRNSRFDYWVDFPELGYWQVYDIEIGQDYSRFSYVETRRLGPNQVRDVTFEKMRELMDNAHKDQTFEYESKILRKVIREVPGKPNAIYTQAIPKGAIFHRFDQLPGNPQVDEVATYADLFDNSIHIENLTIPEYYKHKFEESGWFENHLRQIENYFNERDLQRDVIGRQFRINQCYFESIEALCTSFCKEVSLLMCNNEDSNSFTFTYDKSQGKINFLVEGKFAPLRIICDSDYLSSIFGICPIMKVTTRNRPPSPSLPYDITLPTVGSSQKDPAFGQGNDGDEDEPSIPYEFNDKKWTQDMSRFEERKLRKQPKIASELETKEHLQLEDSAKYVRSQMLVSRMHVPKPKVLVNEETSYVYEFPCESVKPARLDSVNSLIVYSDVGEFLDTGGMLTRHLARFDVADRPGQQVSYAPHQPIYVPVAKSDIDYITIFLRDEYGRIPPFAVGHDCSVSVKLHFRKL